MENKETSLERRKFLGWLSVLSVTAIAGVPLLFGKKQQAVKKIKMLTQDGKLVEVDESLIRPGGKRVTDKELQKWVTKK